MNLLTLNLTLTPVTYYFTFTLALMARNRSISSQTPKIKNDVIKISTKIRHKGRVPLADYITCSSLTTMTLVPRQNDKMKHWLLFGFETGFAFEKMLLNDKFSRNTVMTFFSNGMTKTHLNNLNVVDSHFEKPSIILLLYLKNLKWP